jgi:hypothetical protein
MDKAIEAATAAYKGATTQKALRGRSLYLVADAEFNRWRSANGQEAHFVNAKTCYQEFATSYEPKHNAHANLACLFALRAAKEDQQRTSYEEQALAAFDASLTEINAYNGDQPDREKAYFVNSYRRGGGDCGAALSSLWDRRRPSESYDKTIAAIVGQF